MQGSWGHPQAAFRPKWPVTFQASFHALASPLSAAWPKLLGLASRTEHTDAVSLPFKARAWEPQDVTVATFYWCKPSVEASVDQGKLDFASSREEH